MKNTKARKTPNTWGDPKSEILDEWQERAGGWVKKIAIAPERDGAVDFMKHAKTKDIYVALAHTDATYEDCKNAGSKPVNIFVHTYNRMRAANQVVVGAALTLPKRIRRTDL